MYTGKQLDYTDGTLMFGISKKIPVIVLSRTTIEYGVVSLGKNPTWKQLGTVSSIENDLSVVLPAIATALQSRTWRVVLTSDISYLLELPIPAEIQHTRQYLSQALTQIIPEELHNDEWDYSERPALSKNVQRKVLIFAPASAVWRPFIQAAKQTKIQCSAVEPEAIATQRNPLAPVGIALKKDLDGADGLVLNLNIEHQSHDSGGKHTTIALVFILIIALLSIPLAISFQSTRQRQPAPTPQASPTPIPSPTPSPEPTPDPSQYRVQILNASGRSGAATGAQQVLEQAGFTLITTGNAPVVASSSATIRMKEAIPESIYLIIQASLGNIPLERSPLSSTASEDIVIVLSKKE